MGNGRTLFLPAGEGFAIASVEGDTTLAAGWKDAPGVQALASDGKLDGYWPALRQKLSALGVLVTGIRGVYAATFQDGSVLLLNTTDAAQNAAVKGKNVALPPVSLIEVP